LFANATYILNSFYIIIHNYVTASLVYVRLQITTKFRQPLAMTLGKKLLLIVHNF